MSRPMRGSDLDSEKSVDEQLDDVLPNFTGPVHYAPSNDVEGRLDRRINLKFDLTILPLLAIGFVMCGIDKSAIGAAATTKIVAQAHLSKDAIPNSVSLIACTFVPLQPFSIALAKKIGPHLWIPIQLFLFGAITVAHMAIKGDGQLYALRLLLGAAEAGFLPSCALFMSAYFPSYSFGKRMGIYAGAYSVAGAFMSVMAYGIFKADTSLYPWQLMFVIFGSISMFFGLVCLLWLPRDGSTWWLLNAEEKAHFIRRRRIDSGQHVLDGEGQLTPKLSRRDVRDALTYWQGLAIVVFNICATLPVSAFGVFMPIIVKGMGYTALKANLMSVSPFVVGCFGLICFVVSSDYRKERSLHTVFAMGLAIVGLIVMATSKDQKLRYGFVHVALAGCFTPGPLVIAWLAGNSPEGGVRTLMIGINGYSNLASVIAGQLFKSRYAPSYTLPLGVTAGLVGIGMLGFVGMRLILMNMNRRRKQWRATATPEEIEAERLALDRRGHQKRTFVFGL